jgi:hypothetical protein
VISPRDGILVVVCRDRSERLLLIPFAVDVDGGALSRLRGSEGRAGKVREIAVATRPYGLITAVVSERGHVLLIKWSVGPDGAIKRLGESGSQAGEGSSLSVAALPFTDKATVCTAVRDGSAKLLPISWDDADGPGELSVV